MENNKQKFYPEIELEDLPDEQLIKELQRIGKEAAAQAIAESKALGLPITFLENGKIIKEHADGKREILGEVPPPTIVETGIKYDIKED